MLLKRTLHNPVKIEGVLILPGIQNIDENQIVRLPRDSRKQKDGEKQKAIKKGPIKGPLCEHPSWIAMLENGTHEKVKAPTARGNRVTGNPGNMGEADALKTIKEIVSIPALEKQLANEEKKQNKRPKIIQAIKEQIIILDATIKEDEESEEA